MEKLTLNTIVNHVAETNEDARECANIFRQLMTKDYEDCQRSWAEMLDTLTFEVEFNILNVKKDLQHEILKIKSTAEMMWKSDLLNWLFCNILENTETNLFLIRGWALEEKGTDKVDRKMITEFCNILKSYLQNMFENLNWFAAKVTLELLEEIKADYLAGDLGTVQDKLVAVLK